MSLLILTRRDLNLLNAFTSTFFFYFILFRKLPVIYMPVIKFKVVTQQGSRACISAEDILAPICYLQHRQWDKRL